MIVTFVFVIHRIRCFVTPRLLRPGVGAPAPCGSSVLHWGPGHPPAEWGPSLERFPLTVDLSLELRRLHLDLVFCYNIVFGHINSDDLFTFSTVAHTRGHGYKLYKPRCVSSVRRNFFY